MRAQAGLGRVAVALGLALADAEHGLEPGRERRDELARERLVGLAEERAALGVAEQHAGRARVDQHPARRLARERPLRRVVGVLAPDADAGVADEIGDEVERRERRAEREVDLVELVDQPQERLAVVGRLRARLEHLPVACDERRALHQDSSGGIAATPGRTWPSSSSRPAPPPVET